MAQSEILRRVIDRLPQDVAERVSARDVAVIVAITVEEARA